MRFAVPNSLCVHAQSANAHKIALQNPGARPARKRGFATVLFLVVLQNGEQLFQRHTLVMWQVRRCLDFVKTTSPIGLSKYRVHPAR